MAKDLFHEAVKIALEKDGWQITHDPYYLEALGTDIQIDLGAEKLIGAQRDKEYIAVEVKSFAGPSLVYDFHLALGQYMNYVRGLRKNDPDRMLFLAVPKGAYTAFFVKTDVSEAVKEFGLNLVIYDGLKQAIVDWLKA